MERRGGVMKTREQKGRKHLSQVALCFQRGRNMRAEGAELKIEPYFHNPALQVVQKREPFVRILNN